jgi:hypothetical protein
MTAIAVPAAKQAKSAKHSTLNDADFDTIFTISLLDVFSLAVRLRDAVSISGELPAC